MQLAFMGLRSCPSSTTRLGSICEGEYTGFAQIRSELLKQTFTKAYNILITKEEHYQTRYVITKFPAVLVRPQETTGTLLGLSEAFCGVLALLLS